MTRPKPGVQGLVGLALIVLGLCVWIVGFVPPALRSLWSLSWVEAQCAILESRVARHGERKIRHKVEVRYSYVVEGARYTSERYDFYPDYGGTRGGSTEAMIVEGLPPGTSTRCWVNPRDPAEAVIDRSLGWEGGAIRCTPLVFVAVGVLLVRTRQRGA